MSDLWSALCLVLVIEGLILFAVPQVWKRTAEQLQAMPIALLRRAGMVMLACGLVALYFVRQVG